MGKLVNYITQLHKSTKDYTLRECKTIKSNA